MEDYSFTHDLLLTWRSTSDWVKVVVVTAIPGQILFLFYLVLRLKAEQRAMLSEDMLAEERIKKLVHIEMNRLVEAMERARKVKVPRLTGDTGNNLPFEGFDHRPAGFRCHWHSLAYR